jgi:hypothetical protein
MTPGFTAQLSLEQTVDVYGELHAVLLSALVEPAALGILDEIQNLAGYRFCQVKTCYCGALNPYTGDCIPTSWVCRCRS